MDSWYRQWLPVKNGARPFFHELDTFINFGGLSHVNHAPSRGDGVSFGKFHPRILALRRVFGVKCDIVVCKT